MIDQVLLLFKLIILVNHLLVNDFKNTEKMQIEPNYPYPLYFKLKKQFYFLILCKKIIIENSPTNT